MHKRTSDFMALAAILGGAGLGLGLTSLPAFTPEALPWLRWTTHPWRYVSCRGESW